MFTNLPGLKDPRAVYWYAIGASLLLSFYIACRETVINADAICYLQSASTIGQSGLYTAMHLCDQAQWPFYSILIFLATKLSFLPPEVAAFSLDAIFSALSVFTFVTIVRQLGGSQRVLWLAAMVILLAHEFNSVRQYIVRDHGFFAFYLLSISFFLRYLNIPGWINALSWSASLFVATLFRIEGAIFLLLIPFALGLFRTLSYRQRVLGFLQLNAPLFIVGFAGFGWLIFHPEISLSSLGRMQDLVFQIFHAGGLVWQRFQASSTALAQSVLTTDSVHEAPWVFFLTLVAWYISSVVVNLSVIYSGLVIYAIMGKALRLKPASRLALGAYLLTNFLITALFLAERLFLSKRYLIALSLLLMLWVPFALDKLIEAWKMQRLPKMAKPLVIIGLAVSSLGGIFDFGYSKAYLHQAGTWLAENVRHDQSIYSNDYHVMYYSNHFGNDIFTKFHEYTDSNFNKSKHPKRFDYLALQWSKKDLPDNMAELAKPNLKLVKVFSNRRGDQVRIYKGI